MINPSISLFQQSWIAPKQEYTDEQNEDACRIELTQQDNGPATLLIAVSDGASGAVYSRLWSRALVEAIGSDWPVLGDEELTARLRQVRQEFKPLDSVAEVPWYVKTKLLTEGSQATLLVATVACAENPDSVEVRAVSVGDSCLLLFTRADLQVHSFPIGNSNDFGVNPSLVGTLNRPLEYSRLPPTLMRPGDFLLVCTDAIGKWVMQCLESGASNLFFEVLLELLTPDTDGHNPSVGASSVQVNSQPNAYGIVPSAGSISQSFPAPPARSASRLRRILGWFGWRQSRLEQRPAPPEPVMVAPQASEVASPEQPSLVNNEPEVETSSPATTESGIATHSKFQRFVQQYRGPQAKPRMRDDDSTLVLCLPVRGGDDGLPQKAVEVIRNYQAAVSGHGLPIQPLNQAPPLTPG